MQEWHEGLREYPDLSLAPHLRRQQFRAKSREIRGRALARCGGLQILHLAENKVLLKLNYISLPSRVYA